MQLQNIERFEFRNIKKEEIEQAAFIEQVCFPPNEACTKEHMRQRILAAPELFLVAVHKQTGEIAGFLNGVATDETDFRDEFLADAGLHNPDGKNIMLCGLDVLPKYRGQGLARQLVELYKKREKKSGRNMLILTCVEEKIAMYESFGFGNCKISKSVWGGVQWYEMSYQL